MIIIFLLHEIMCNVASSIVFFKNVINLQEELTMAKNN